MPEDAKCPVDHSSRAAWMQKAAEAGSCPAHKGCSSDDLNKDIPGTHRNSELSQEREVSTIPRTDRDSNWVYPSQQMFFDAMKRKNFDPETGTMKSIIPIHNAVNERAWMEILKWEEGQGAEACGGPKLDSFSGDASKLTPTARWNMFWGYEKPFDRHDWVVDRCGKRVEYVIDFYAGKPNPLVPDMPSFFLDTRPKLNSFEGIKLRAMKWVGLK